MERRKISKVKEVNLVEPMTWLKEDGTIHPIRKFCGDRGFYIVERDGQCYVVFDTNTSVSQVGILLAIKEKFDDLEGEEIKDTGGNASETEE